MTPARFCFAFASFVLALCLLVGGVNVVVDPYLLFDTPRLPGFNARKPAAATQEALMKAHDAPRQAARTVILGSSRTDIGLDPASRSWRADDQPIYNLSLAGGNARHAAHYLQHLVGARPTARGEIRTLVIGLDFESFLYRPGSRPVGAAPASQFRIANLAVHEDGRANPQYRFEQLVDYATGSLSLDALIDSLTTFKANWRSSGSNLEPSGRLAESGLRESLELNGAAALFAHKNGETVRQYRTPQQVLSEPASAPVRDLGSVRKLIDLGRSLDADVILFIQPAHVDRLELLDGMGYWPDFERWKRELVGLVGSERGKGARVALWDFCGYEPFAQEPPPPRQTGKALAPKWFWEPVHYTSALGDIMIAVMLKTKATEAYGVQLDAASVEARLEQVRRDRDAYRLRFPEERRRVVALLGN